MEIILLPGNQLALSYNFCKPYGVPKSTLRKYVQAKPESVYYDEEGRCFFRYACLSPAICKRLPPIPVLAAACKKEVKQEVAQTVEMLLQTAYSSGHLPYVTHYLNAYAIDRKKAVEFARKRACWEVIAADIAAGSKDAEARRKGWNKVFGKAIPYHSFANMVSKLKKLGAEQLAADERIRNGAAETWQATPEQEAATLQMIADGRKFSDGELHKMHTAYSLEHELKPMSKSWVTKLKQEWLAGNIHLYAERYGERKTLGKYKSWLPMLAATQTNGQWQMDGVTLAFWIGGKCDRYTFFIVLDAHSKKLVGSAVGQSENTDVVMTALRDAMKNTGCIPAEIVADNASYHKTKERDYLNGQMTERGLHGFTVTHNPQWKSYVERYNQYLDSLFKNYPGYLGKGQGSKSDDARPKEELIREYMRNQLTPEQITTMACNALVAYNGNVLEQTGKTPNEQYDAGEQNQCFKLREYEWMQVTEARTEKMVRRCMILIERAGITSHYRLDDSADVQRYNNRTVGVRYVDLAEGIYLYDLKRDDFICFCHRLNRVHGAKADRTEADEIRTYAHAAKNKKLVKDSRETFENAIKKGLETNPDMLEEVYTIMNKDAKKEAQKSADVKRMLTEIGIDADNLPDARQPMAVEKISLSEPASNKVSPFRPKSNEVKRIDPYAEAEKDFEDD